MLECILPVLDNTEKYIEMEAPEGVYNQSFSLLVEDRDCNFPTTSVTFPM